MGGNVLNSSKKHNTAASLFRYVSMSSARQTTGSFCSLFTTKLLQNLKGGWLLHAYSNLKVIPEICSWIKVWALTGPFCCISFNTDCCFNCVLPVIVLMEGVLWMSSIGFSQDFPNTFCSIHIFSALTCFTFLLLENLSTA